MERLITDLIGEFGGFGLLIKIVLEFGILVELKAHEYVDYRHRSAPGG